MEKTDNMRVNCTMCKAPFKSTLSLQYLIKDIERINKDPEHPMQSMAKDVLAQLESAPELKKNDLSREDLDKNEALVKRLMAFTFNPLTDKVDYGSAWKPFDMQSGPIYSTSAFEKVLGGDHRQVELAKDITDNQKLVHILYQAYFIILEKFFQLNIPIDLPFALKRTDTKDNSIRYFNTRFNTEYLRVKVKGKLKELDADSLKMLFDNDHDLDLWNEIIPLDKFEFHGLLILNYNDVTRDFVISDLKSDLLRKETILSKDGFLKIKSKIRTLINNPHAEFGMAANYGFETAINQNFIWNTIIPREELDCHDYQGTVYEKAFKERRIVITADFEKEEKNDVVDAFLERGIRSHAIVPLVLDDEIMGMLEFGCKMPGAITMIQIKLLHDLFPVFALAMKRSKEDWDDMVRSVIQEQFTAIHPTVEWRFRQEAALLINEDQVHDSSSMNNIVFPDVVPIYGASDIRGSSIERNLAIREDLKTQLVAASSILEANEYLNDVPLLSDLRFKISKHLTTVEAGLRAGDEVVIIEFLKNEIDPVFSLLKGRYPDMVDAVDAYFKMLDPELGVLYNKRKDFEESLTMINDQVSDVIEKEQVRAQAVFPHYFEKYRTDGVEYNGYIGQSLVNNLEYSDIYLKNIRLWQLLVKVRVARTVRDLQPDLKTRLDITQLILVHSNPLSIAFRQDEKKFDVAGAYNIRYEITKKRIDKALIKGTNERITQVGKIAIIYSHADEIAEYKHYVEYLQAQGFITDKVEELELEDLKGASGLRALRIEVDYNGTALKEINEKMYESVLG